MSTTAVPSEIPNHESNVGTTLNMERKYIKVGSNVFYHEEQEETMETFPENSTTKKVDFLEDTKTEKFSENLQMNEKPSLVNLLKKNWKLKNEKNQDSMSILEENLMKKASTEGYLTRMEHLESEDPNTNVSTFQQELSPEEKDLILLNMKRQRKNFLLLKQRDRKHRVLKVKTVHPYLSNEEIITSLENDCENEEECVVQFTNVTFKFVNFLSFSSLTFLKFVEKLLFFMELKI
jgi:hypothetical protein